MQQNRFDPLPDRNHRPAPDLLAAAAPPPCWFALYTTSRHEKRVLQHLHQRAIECFLPLYQAKRKWADGSRVTLDLPLFPGYLFVRICRNQRGKVLGVPGALAVVGGTGGEPASLPDATIDALRLALDSRLVQPHPLLTVGRRARIRSGPLAGLEGIVTRTKSSFRVVLTLDHIRQSYAAEVALEDLEPLSSGPPSPVVNRNRSFAIPSLVSARSPRLRF